MSISERVAPQRLIDGPMAPMQALPAVVAGMLDPSFYPHAVRTPIQLLQTHISYVLLTGDYAYKVKKPVDLGFLDFSTLERRQHYCREELRLNQRLAPDLYLDVLPIVATGEGGYRLTAAGETAADPIVEYALRMRQFPQNTLFSRMFERGELTLSHVVELAEAIARFHLAAPTDPQIQQWGTLDAIRQVATDNYTASLPFIGRDQTWEQFQQTRAFSDNIFEQHADWFTQRLAEGRIRECHGDLHLNNVCRFNDRVCIFDCIEFNEAFRDIDVIYDVAFMVMDLEFRGRRDLAYAFLNSYLEQTGDYRGVLLLPLYSSMRAYVRAKINSFMLDEPDVPQDTREHAQHQAAAYYRKAWEYSHPSHGRLVIMSGLSGSGKTTLARYLARQLGAIHIRSDAVRKHLAGVPLRQRGGPELYTPALTEQTYAGLLELGLLLAGQGRTVVLDAKYDRRHLRRPLIERAVEAGLPLHIIHCRAPTTVLAQRLRERPADISDATPELLCGQAQAAEPFDESERPLVLSLDTTSDWQPRLAAFAAKVG